MIHQKYVRLKRSTGKINLNSLIFNIILSIESKTHCNINKATDFYNHKYLQSVIV